MLELVHLINWKLQSLYKKDSIVIKISHATRSISQVFLRDVVGFAEKQIENVFYY